VLMDPAALKLTQLLPFQQYTLLSSVSSASWPVNAPATGRLVTRSTVDSLASFAAVTAPEASCVAPTAPLARALPGMLALLNRILAFGMVASAISVTALPRKSVTVIFLDSLALMSATASKSPAARSAPARAANSEMRRSAMMASAPIGDYCSVHLNPPRDLPTGNSHLAPAATVSRLLVAACWPLLYAPAGGWRQWLQSQCG
jgi:hypothetical protein